MLKACLLVVLLCGVAHAGDNWLYTEPDDEKPAECSQSVITIDTFWNKLNLSFGECTLNTSREVLVRGFFFECPTPTGKVVAKVFRSKKACMSQITFDKTGMVPPLVSLAPAKLAPATAKDKLMWAETLTTHFNGLTDTALQDAIDEKRLQQLVDVVDCSALVSSNFISGGGLQALVAKYPKATQEELKEKAKEISNFIAQKCLEKTKPEK